MRIATRKNQSFDIGDLTRMGQLWATFVLIGCVFVLPDSARADPCGMVPPIYTRGGVSIVRKGLQKTYVFHRGGIETFVIRPGYEGKVEDFGMLIPFPTPPSIRKVPDQIFTHLANAVDPPEVVVDLRRILKSQIQLLDESAELESENSLKLFEKKEVVVLRQEAVGMYEVAVLAAGSADALKRWMDDKGYQYPKGMDKVTQEYIELKWCFVAVKTKVSGKNALDPQPAQRKVKAGLPKGATFDGNVQAMGFRFKTDELVLPMRLSAFNGGDLRNLVYLLSDKPQRIQDIPEEFVQRQISGAQLIKNITEPLPLRIIGGKYSDLSEDRIARLKIDRDPAPKNSLAKDLFAYDLQAASSGKLSMSHEEREKELLRISEHLWLRGQEIDQLHTTALESSRDIVQEKQLADLASMTLTVVDGDFPREVIARDNLHFEEYEMASSENNVGKYDAKIAAPQTVSHRNGALYYGTDLEIQEQTEFSPWTLPLFIGLSLGMVGFLVLCLRRFS